MKIYKYSISLAIISIGLIVASCSDYFNQVPEDRLSLNNVFSTRNGAIGYLSGVYTYIPDEFNQRQVQETSLYRTPGPWTAGCDEAGYPSNKADLINNNTLDPNEDTMVKYRWKSWYSGIHESAVFTKYIDSAPSDQVSDSEKKQWKAEARALNAIYYFYLLRTYGPIPILKEDYNQDTPSDKLQLPRASGDDRVNYIVSEVKAAQSD